VNSDRAGLLILWACWLLFAFVIVNLLRRLGWLPS
jgi:hypothetical protein